MKCIADVDTRHPLREIPIDDPRVAINLGYRESKWVMEQVLTAAAEAGLSSCSVRIGQITGNVNGAWGVHEWFPAALKSSQAIGCLPMDHRVCFLDYATVMSMSLTAPSL